MRDKQTPPGFCGSIKLIHAHSENRVRGDFKWEGRLEQCFFKGNFELKVEFPEGLVGGGGWEGWEKVETPKTLWGRGMYIFLDQYTY